MRAASALLSSFSRLIFSKQLIKYYISDITLSKDKYIL